MVADAGVLFMSCFFTGLGREYALAFAERGASVVGKYKDVHFMPPLIPHFKNRYQFHESNIIFQQSCSRSDLHVI